MVSASKLEEKKARLLEGLCEGLKSLPEDSLRRFTLRSKSSSGRFEDERIDFKMNLGCFQERDFFCYTAVKSGVLPFFIGLSSNDIKKYRVFGLGEKVLLLGVYKSFGAQTLPSELTIDELGDDLVFLEALVLAIEDEFARIANAARLEASERRSDEKSSIPTPSTTQADENPFLLLGLFEFAFLATLVVAFFPWSLLLSLLINGLERTKLLIAALAHDFLKTLFVAFSVLGSLFLAVLLAISLV